ncbi:hypothetical protein MKW92_041155, partial [Papaver armeniacum]
PKLVDEKQTTIYKRAMDKSYNLKMKASRFIFNDISHKFPIIPFSDLDSLQNKCSFVTFQHRLSALEEKQARLGWVECMNHELLKPYHVLHEKSGDFVAQIKFTVLLMPNGSDRRTSHALQELTDETVEAEPMDETSIATTS